MIRQPPGNTELDDTDQESICPERPINRSSSGNRSHTSVRGLKVFFFVVEDAVVFSFYVVLLLFFFFMLCGVPP